MSSASDLAAYPSMVIQSERDAYNTHDAASALDERRWLALLRREPEVASAEGRAEAFFYGVTSTGVVCRPDCPSRRPRRENTRFFDTVDKALAAGFRVCRRCRPEGGSLTEETAARIDRVRRELERSSNPVPLARLAEIAGLSPFHLQRVFRAALGVSPAAYGRRVRAERFEAALDAGSVTDALYSAGYGSPSGVYARREASAGMTPGNRKRGGEHQHIRYTLADSPLDRMLVAATDRGVCLIAFDRSDEVLREELRVRFPSAVIEAEDDALAAHVRGVMGYLTEPAKAQRLPLHVRATAFQQRVWQALGEIPAGETWTYGQLAKHIGAPAASRAVGAACGANPVAPVVPCHRVVGSTGSLTGYRWGKERKRRLLDLEAKVQATGDTPRGDAV